MKTTLLIILGLLMAVPLLSQSKTDEISILQASFGMEKKEIVQSFVTVQENQKEAFWKIYDEYETKRKALGKIRIELLTEYAEKWQDLKGTEADALVKKTIDLSNKTDKLIATYYNKLKKATSTEVAVKFFEIETYILTTIRFYIKNTIPFVNEK